MYDIVYNFRHLEFFEMMRNADEKQLASRFENVSRVFSGRRKILP
jgi:hypothetical protein